MSNTNILENCLSGLNDAACLSRIDDIIPLTNILILACMFFMTLSAVGALVELSSKRIGGGGGGKFISAIALSVYLAFIPVGTYVLQVFKGSSETVTTLTSISWFHQLSSIIAT